VDGNRNPGPPAAHRYRELDEMSAPISELSLIFRSFAWQNFIFYYGTQFFKNSGINNPFIITIATK
jgi:hypothetical protein